MENTLKKTKTKDMTSGNISLQILAFSLPLMLGNVFQMLYNTVDSIIVGNFIGTEALAAVGSTTMIINMLVFFFNGFSVGAGVVIGQYFGAKNIKMLHRAVETAVTATFLLCILFTIIGILGVRPMLNFMSTPDDVMGEATIYLRIYFAGISGLLLYNIGSGILRAVGDTTRPLYFLILTSVVNIVLDLLFVLNFHMGIAGVAYATIISQFISALLTMALLVCTKDIYHFSFKDMKLHPKILARIWIIGLPAGIQSVLTSFSNVFVQSYVNSFGSTVMAGWSCYNKLDQYIMLPMQSTSMAATTFVSQNIGAKQYSRANKGAITAIALSVGITFIIATLLFVFSSSAVSLFTVDEEVIRYGSTFIRVNVYFLLFNCVNHTLAGALRGRGDSRGPMVIMLISFVALRQIYLFLVTNLVANTPTLVALGYPVGWVSCCIIEVSYFYIRWIRRRHTND